MNDALPEVFWARPNDGDGPYRAYVSTNVDTGMTVMFGPPDHRLAHRLGDEQATIYALGYETDGLMRLRTAVATRCDPPADPAPLPMRPGFADPATTPPPEFQWARVLSGRPEGRIPADPYTRLRLVTIGAGSQVVVGEASELDGHTHHDEVMGMARRLGIADPRAWFVDPGSYEVIDETVEDAGTLSDRPVDPPGIRRFRPIAERNHHVYQLGAGVESLRGIQWQDTTEGVLIFGTPEEMPNGHVNTHDPAVTEHMRRHYPDADVSTWRYGLHFPSQGAIEEVNTAPVEAAPVEHPDMRWVRITGTRSEVTRVGAVYRSLVIDYAGNTDQQVFFDLAPDTTLHRFDADTSTKRAIRAALRAFGYEPTGYFLPRYASSTAWEFLDETPTTTIAGATIAEATITTPTEAAEVQRLNEQHQADLATIGRILMREANDRSWCDEYDEIVAAINAEISSPLPVRTVRYRVTYVPPPVPPVETHIDLDVPRGETREAALQRAVPGASLRNARRL